MKSHANSRNLWRSVLLSALGGAALVVVAPPAVADPQTKPTTTLAPYALKNTDLRKGATSAYRPWFENGAWMGDLIEYHISADGQRCTSVAVGAYPPDDSGNSALCPQGNWSARGAFPEKIEQNGDLVDDPDAISYWETRNLFTLTAPGSEVDFEWHRLTPAQRAVLDPETSATDPETVTADRRHASPVLRYIRGDRSQERDKEGGTARLRYSLLGPIINSRPVYVPSGANGLVVAGGNDGIVHGFDAETGNELFGYIPSIFMADLEKLDDVPFRFRYFADGELRARDIGGTRHIVSGGFGSGGKGLFALDVSTASDPTVLFELSGDTGDHIAGPTHAFLGHIHGRPTIARLPDDRWYVVTGNGYGSGAGALLVLIDIETGNVTYITADDSDLSNGLSAPSLVSSTSSFSEVNYAYAGDLNGNLWRFDLADKTADRMFQAGTSKPITVEPDIARHPTQIGVMVYFGTGKLLDSNDSTTDAQQTFYGIWDDDFERTDIDPNSLVPQILEPQVWADDGRAVRIVRETLDPVWSGADKNLGWKVDLPKPGERLLGRPQVRANRVQFITTNPTSDPQNILSGDGSWFNQLSLASGGSLDKPVPLYDLDRSGVLDLGDALTTIDGEAVDPSVNPFYPLSLNLGAGNIAQPTFASVIQDIDAVFINAILLPTPEPPIVNLYQGGDLDVTTDSAAGPMVSPHDEDHPKYADYGYTDTYPDYGNQPAARGPMNDYLGADGPGDQVDGHHRAYNKVHGVNYVDFFDIEPQARAGGLRLDPGKVDVNGQPFYAMRELNQPGEDPWGEELFAPDQPFIVVLTNADLSLGTQIQIGCRTWPSFDYQEMITAQLKAGTEPAKLRDEKDRSLVFTLNDILTDTGGGADCDESTKTLRLSVTQPVGRAWVDYSQDPPVRDISIPVIHGTLPGCVNNTHLYDGSLDTVGTNPHITPNQENPNGGFRWRNGALTMQLLAVKSDGTRDYVLQDVELPTPKKATDLLGKGGIFAKGFDYTKKDGIIPYSGSNGMLFEASMFWNWGDMYEFQQEGKPSRCYGESNYNAEFINELGGLNKAQYDQIVSCLRGDSDDPDCDPDLLSDYESGLLALTAATTEDALRAALVNLAAIWDSKAGERGNSEDYTLGYYHILRLYAHGDKFKNLDLLDIDKDLFAPPPVDINIDGTPADVADVELDLLPAAGPNYAPGRRSWIDVTPE